MVAQFTPCRLVFFLQYYAPMADSILRSLLIYGILSLRLFWANMIALFLLLRVQPKFKQFFRSPRPAALRLLNPMYLVLKHTLVIRFFVVGFLREARKSPSSVACSSCFASAASAAVSVLSIAPIYFAVAMSHSPCS